MFYLSKEDFPTLGNTPNEKPCVSISNKKGRGEETVLVPYKEVNVKKRRKKIAWSRKMDWAILSLMHGGEMVDVTMGNILLV